MCIRDRGYGVRWRWCSGTWSTTDKKDGEKAAEISTLAFYNSNVSGSWKRASVYSYTRDNGTAYVGYLFTGTFDKNSDSYSLGIAHTARPKSISFDYKYAPLPSTDPVSYTHLSSLREAGRGRGERDGDFPVYQEGRWNEGRGQYLDPRDEVGQHVDNHCQPESRGYHRQGRHHDYFR